MSAKIPCMPGAVHTWPLARLQPYVRNARTHGADQDARIAASMAEFGWTVLCLVAEDGELIAGHDLVMAATSSGCPRSFRGLSSKTGSSNFTPTSDNGRHQTLGIAR